MAKLTDLPEELLSYICDETDRDSLVPLAVTCRRLNRLAGSRYLSLIKFSDHNHSLNIYPKGSHFSISFDELQNVLKILHSLRNVSYIDCTFFCDPRIALRQMKLLTLALRRIAYRQISFSLNFPTGYLFDRDTSSKGPGKDGIFHKAWEDLIREAQRLEFRSFRIGGVPPFLPHAPIGKFGLSQNTSLTFCTISSPSFVLGQTHRDWLKGFLNSSPSILHFRADYAREWTQLLPKIHMPSLQLLQFDEYAIDHRIKPASLEVLAEFCDRHKRLTRLTCGTGFGPPSTTASGTHRRYLMTNVRCIQATVAQLQYFLSSPTTCPNLRTIEIETSPTDIQIWKLFPLLNQHPSVQRLILHHDQPGLVRDVGPSQKRLDLRSMKLLHVQFVTLEYQRWPDQLDAVDADFLRWAAQTMTGAQVLEVLRTGTVKDEDKSFLAQRVAEEWPSIKFLRIDKEIRRVKSWYEEEEEPDLEEGEDQWIPVVPHDRGWE